MAASRTAEVANGSIATTPLSSATLIDEATIDTSLSTPTSVIAPPLVEQLGEAQLGLVRVRGQRGSAGVGVHHEEVDGVGTYVEHTESHSRPR
ncbi:hypothetical protein GCM10023235_34510 [Kitasatospora terrestris]|uniref:Uncharacterized protein n=1 Tax=Kitasatospora terrestris TaxID=258051 RepID=A0ABP9DND0_9ACTN